jgi:hypothetical protein
VRFLAGAMLPILVAVVAHAEPSQQPYIDELKKSLPPGAPAADSVPDPYIRSLKEKMAKDPQAGPAPGESYTDFLKRTEVKDARPDSDSYSAQEKAKLPPSTEGGAIQAYKEGRSELKPRMSGDIHHAAGLKIGTTLTQNVTASGDFAARSFQDVYTSTPIPGLTFFYEYQPFHSEWFGNLGLVASLGASLSRGKGVFAADIGYGGASRTSRTQFSFVTVPATLALNYRFNLLRLLRPYVQLGPTLVGYFESRSDRPPGHRGYSRAVSASGGVNILLDFMDRRSSWERYEGAGIKHSYLTVDFTRLSTFSGDVDFTDSGFNVGLTFEF